jgi:hypothetical protein
LVVFKWEPLATLAVGTNVTALSGSLAVQRIPVGKTVHKGDSLGIALSPAPGSSPPGTPLGYLIQDITGIKTDHVLYALPRTHVSPSGLDLQSPVNKLVNRELKWYAIID